MDDDKIKNFQKQLNEDIKTLNWTDSILSAMSAIVVNAYIAGYNRALTDIEENNNDIPRS